MKFKLRVYAVVSVIYEVEAEDEDEAFDKADGMFLNDRIDSMLVDDQNTSRADE